MSDNPSLAEGNSRCEDRWYRGVDCAERLGRGRKLHSILGRLRATRFDYFQRRGFGESHVAFFAAGTIKNRGEQYPLFLVTRATLPIDEPNWATASGSNAQRILRQKSHHTFDPSATPRLKAQANRIAVVVRIPFLDDKGHQTPDLGGGGT